VLATRTSSPASCSQHLVQLTRLGVARYSALPSPPKHAALVRSSEAGQELRRKVSGERRLEGRAARPRSRPPIPFDRPRNATPHVILAISLPLMH
jgi:hypothetical protein